MADDVGMKKRPPQAVFEPGTLDNTRKNIGVLDAEEAAKMQKVLGGEVFTEKSAPIDYSKLPKKAVDHRAYSPATGHTSYSVSAGNTNASTSAPNPKKAQASAPAPKKIKHVADLPSISQKDNQLIDRLMMSAEYGIKKNYGVFNFIRPFIKDGTERVLPGFCEITLKNHIDHIQNFITVVKTMIQNSPDTYKSKISNESDNKFKFLRKVATWNTRDIKLGYIDLDSKDKVTLVSELVPFVKAVYKQVITIYFLGDSTITQMIKDIYNDIMKYPKANKDKFQMLSKQAITEWVYIHSQVIAGLYPLLMRMVGTPFCAYPKFFTQELSAILKFVDLKKFDLLQKRKKSKQKIKQKKKLQNLSKKKLTWLKQVLSFSTRCSPRQDSSTLKSSLTCIRTLNRFMNLENHSFIFLQTIRCRLHLYVSRFLKISSWPVTTCSSTKNQTRFFLTREIQLLRF